ncbi:hypothetical protein AIOL_004169 [Candidatus Rhodobacter oscarellae]|uniref:Uncharacterized protein n=1 Tax=Candidatus Rhodobacter oscarellae TaxID=1675527 RepID=A0A0J9H0C5_9RHOB|nr:DUF6636 domain-containing protein [Candidatus Rhodobacter lobularis]KMW59188.1 hypothetical protein AIOL_004169 [Candidatus Rhodobacter lobularis]
MLRYIALLSCLAGPALADGFGFRTPSANIFCNGSLQGGAQLYCTIINHNGSGGCASGRQFDMRMGERGRVQATCGRPSGKASRYTDIAEYGATGNFGRITCTSQTTGFTCTNADGHGFFLSRAKQLVF